MSDLWQLTVSVRELGWGGPSVSERQDLSARAWTRISCLSSVSVFSMHDMRCRAYSFHVWPHQAGKHAMKASIKTPRGKRSRSCLKAVLPTETTASS